MDKDVIIPCGTRVRSLHPLRYINDNEPDQPAGAAGTIKLLYQKVIVWDNGAVSFLGDVMFEIVRKSDE